MLLNNNFIVTTLLNETCYDHPSFYNIVLALSLKIFEFNTFPLRFPSALSLLLTGILTYRFGKIYIPKNFGIISALYCLISVDIYFYFSNLTEFVFFLLAFSAIKPI
jgi:4-amino-4-deoxy-L-arabinose transferase-like glycosyltransferase